MANDPDETGRMSRRKFVKGCVTAGAAGAVFAGGFSMGKPISIVEGGTSRSTTYISAKKVGGPAPRGIPLLPLQVDDEGYLAGRPTLGGESVLDWYKYCGHENAPGLQEDYEPETERLEYFVVPSKLKQGFDPWYGDRIGEHVHVDDFDELDLGAAVRWRSQGEEGANLITAVVINTEAERHAFEGVDESLVMDAGLSDGFIAFVTYCTHFCCVPGWKEAEQQARSRNAWDDILCTCHFSIYDPFTLTEETFQPSVGGGETSPLKPGAGGDQEEA